MSAVLYNWCSATVADILSKQEYCGDTVSFRYTSKSFKSKKRIERPSEEWQLFKDTYPAIIDRETFTLVQELRRHRRRPTKSGIVCIFSGLLYCADCGEKLYYSVTNNCKREQSYFFCSSYRKSTEVCTAHYIREKAVYELVLERMRRVFLNVQVYEEEFVHKQMECYSEDKKKELAAKRRALGRMQKRIGEIDGLVQKIYEDNAKGKRVQLIDIYYTDVGIVREMSAEEMEEAFQKRMAQRKRTEEKTA